jgi:hypothetical protein
MQVTSDFDYLMQCMAKVRDYEMVTSTGAQVQALEACEAAIGASLPPSLRAVLRQSNGFDLRDSDGSFLRVYPTEEIVSRTAERRRVWADTECWGDFVEIARSDETESTYAVHLESAGAAESPLFEIWSEGYDEWHSNRPLAPSFGTWLRVIGDAVTSEDHDRVYATLWLGSSRPRS